MKRKYFILPFVLVALIAVTALTGCNGNSGGASAPPSEAVQGVYEIGQGAVVFRFEVVDDAEVLTVWEVSTDEETVAAALVGVGLISGDESDWGLMVIEVNGLVADWDANQSFWAFYIDGEFAMAGADATDIEPGATYAFVYTAG